MIKRISFAAVLALLLLFSLAAIQAEDADAVNASYDAGFQLEDNTSLKEVADDAILENDNASLENVKNQSRLAAQTNSVYYNGNYKVTLTDSNTSAPLANRNVSFLINNVKYSSKTNAKGIASVNVKLNPGNYAFSACFAGDDAYGPSNNLSGQLKVLTTIKANDVTKYYKSAKSYKATYLDANGNALKNRKVTITLNGKKYSKKTDSKGAVSFPIDLKPGTYKIATSNPSTGYRLTTTFKILSTVSSASIKKVKGDSKKFTAKFLKSNGKPLAKTYVKVKINGIRYYYKTNSKGEVKLSFNAYKKGTYKVVSYNNDGLSKTSTVQIYSIATTKITASFHTFLPNDTKEVKIKFSTALDDSSKSGKTIKIAINGNTYSRKTNSNGEITFKLPALNPNVYSIKYSYAGNKFFKSSSASKYITILDTSDSKLTVESTTSFGNLAGTPLKVAYTAGGVPLIRKTVVLTIDNLDYSTTTDYHGIVSLPITLDTGNYTVSYRTFNETKIRGTSGSFPIEVFERINTTIQFQYNVSYKEYSQTFTVNLTGFNGTPMAYERVVMTVAGESYEEFTDWDGIATFTFNMAVGNYKFSVKYAGNNEYKPASATYSTYIQISQYGKGLNEKNIIASNEYLKPTANCQVNNAKIKAKVKSLTKGLTKPLDKAKAIFNYVRDNIYYDYYYNTHKGAVRTLTSGGGNCVDQAHLLVAMYRAAGFKARYVHGTCRFYDDGEYAGHVWTQVLVGKNWICGDPIDYYNGLGVITNWNVKTYYLKAKYLSLPF